MLTVSELNAMPTGAEVISTTHDGSWRKHLEDRWRPVGGGVAISGRLLATFGVEAVERVGLDVAELDSMDIGEIVLDKNDEEWEAVQTGWARRRGSFLFTSAGLVDHYGPIRRKLRQRPGDQPLPTASTGPSMHDLASEVIDQRYALGLKRYGQPLRAMNGRDAVRDTIEELADGLAYALQIREERRLLRAELDKLAVDHLVGQNPSAYATLCGILERYFPQEKP